MFALVAVRAQDLEQLSDLVLELFGVSHPRFGPDFVSVPSPMAFSADVAGFHQIVDDPLSRAFGDSHGHCHVSQPHIGIAVDRQQHLRVAGQEVPPAVCIRT